MSEIVCAFTDGETTCSLPALNGKPFCGEHLKKVGNMKELTQQQNTGLSTKQLLKGVNKQDESPETAALKAAFHEPDPVPQERSAKLPLDPEVQGSQIAVAMIQAEMTDRLKRFGLDGTLAQRKQQGQTKIAPMKVIPRVRRGDSTVVKCPHTGENPVPAGWIPRWVRTKDSQLRPDVTRAQDFSDDGYQYVKDSQGNNITSHLGVAMMAPPEQYAMRVTRTAPLGGLTRDSVIEDAEVAIDQANSRAGYEAGSLFVAKDHRATRHLEETSVT